MTSIPLLLFCPACTAQHIDPPQLDPHCSHECEFCRYVWRPADVPTTGVTKLDTRGLRDLPPEPFVARDILARKVS